MALAGKSRAAAWLGEEGGGQNNEPPDQKVHSVRVEKLLHGRYTVFGSAENE